MAEDNTMVSDTAATGGEPSILTPIMMPKTNPGAMIADIPSVLHSFAPLWVRNVAAPYSQMGLAAAGCGGRLRTAHPNIEFLFNKVAEHAQAVLFHPCARMNRWPEIDVLKTMHKCYVNAALLLNASLYTDSTERPRASIMGAQAIPFKCYFMPFYGSYLRNSQIKLWGQRIMELLTMLIYNDENSFTYGFSQSFVNQVAVPLRDMYKFMLVTLLKVDLAKVTDPTGKD